MEGFRTMFRRPAVPLAEIAWRWSFGAAACVVMGVGLREYLATLPVSNLDRVLLRSRYPTLVLEALAHIFRGSIPRLVLASVVVFSGLALLWIVVASVGRAVTLEAVVEYIRERAADPHARVPEQSGTPPKLPAAVPSRGPDHSSGVWQLRSLTGLHFLRAGVALAACAGGLGALLLAGFVSSKTNPRPGLAAWLSVAVLLLVWLAWSSLSWFLSLASIFVVRQGEDTFAAVAAAVDLACDRGGPVMAVGAWFGLAHLVLFIVAGSFLAVPLAFAQIVPVGYVLIAVLSLALVYFAMADSLYIGLLAGYVAILEGPPTPPSRLTTARAVQLPLAGIGGSTQPSVLGMEAENAMVDQDETILSDPTRPAPESGGASTQPSALSTQPGSVMVDQDETILSDVARPSGTDHRSLPSDR
jgi:hypothetical protein